MPIKCIKKESAKTEKNIFDKLNIDAHPFRINVEKSKSKILTLIDKISINEKEKNTNLRIINYFIKEEQILQFRSAYIERFITILELRWKLTQLGVKDYKLNSRLLINLKKSIEIIDDGSRIEKVTRALEHIISAYDSEYQRIIKNSTKA